MLKSFNLMPNPFISPLNAQSFDFRPNSFISHVDSMANFIASFDAVRKKGDEIWEEDIRPFYEKGTQLMFDNGWWFVLSLPADFYYVDLLELENEITPILLTNLIAEYFNEDKCKELEVIVKEWDLEHFNKNKKIFKDALWAHKASRYTLSIPALTIQVEGVLRSYLDHLSAWSVKKYREELEKEYKGHIPEDGLGLNNFIKLQNLKFLEESMSNFYESFEKPPESENFDDLYRNLLFHGQYHNYDSIGMSTKLFLFLDMIHSILKDLEEYKEHK